jgi:hypothetical protein
MTDSASTEDPDTPWPPAVGELLPRPGGAFGVRVKLETYSLDVTHEEGGPKARGFELILGITLERIDYLEGAILTGILLVPVGSVRDKSPWGTNCVVMIPVRGFGEKNDRVVNVRTAWRLAGPGAPPQLASAYCKP